MSERKTKTDYTNQRIRNFFVVEKTANKKRRKDGKNFYIYNCLCDCGVKFESTSDKFTYINGCKTCSKTHHYKSIGEAVKKATSKNPSRRTILSKLYPESYGGKRGSYANYIINWIKATAYKRNLIWELDSVEAFKLIQEPCHYCGSKVLFPETRNGLDRIDNLQGYIAGNVVPCCYPCNIAKHEMTYEEFKQHILNVYLHWIVSSPSIKE